MSPGLIKMWFSLAAIGFMFISVISIMFSRSKLRGFWRFIVALISYILMILAGIIIFFVVFSGPVSD